MKRMQNLRKNFQNSFQSNEIHLKGDGYMFIIRNFGNDHECRTESEVFEKLREKYSGKHVSVKSTASTGIVKITFVSVPANEGVSIIDTYTHNEVKSF